MVALSARVPEDAFTAEALGVERAGNGVLIREDGIVLTIGYLVTEAEEVHLRTNGGQIVEGHVLGYDQASGFGLIQALEPLDIPAIGLGDSRHARPGEKIVVAGAGGRRRSLAGTIVARQEFAGYWEYLIEEAIFTAPSHPNWGGTALIGHDGDLLGIGSLHLQQQTARGRIVPLNMVVPVELLTPIFDELLTGRARNGRPWLGVYAQEIQKSVVVVGVAGRGPAERAGLRPGDIIRRDRRNGHHQSGRFLSQHVGARARRCRRAPDARTRGGRIRPSRHLGGSRQLPQAPPPALNGCLSPMARLGRGMIR